MDNIYDLYFWANPQRSHTTLVTPQLASSPYLVLRISSLLSSWPPSFYSIIITLLYVHLCCKYLDVRIGHSATRMDHLCFVFTDRVVLFDHFTLTSNVWPLRNSPSTQLHSSVFNDPYAKLLRNGHSETPFRTLLAQTQKNSLTYSEVADPNLY